MEYVSGRGVQAVKNKKTQKLFILVPEDASGGRVRVINLNGNSVLMERHFFEDEVLNIEEDRFPDSFTAEQIAGLSRLKQRISDQAERERLAKEKQSLKSTRATTTRRSTAKKGRVLSKATKIGAIMDQWTSATLIFYRHKIHPLRANDRFCIHVEGHGRFIMSKDQFERTFNEVLMSPKYRQDGIYVYDSIPQRAFQYLSSS